MPALALAALVACTKTEPTQVDVKAAALKRIDSLQNLVRSGSGPVQTQTALQLAEAYQFYALDYKDDSLTLPFIMKEANIYASLGDLPKAAQLFKFGYDTYKNHKLRPNALFFLGNVLNDMKDSAQAVATFKEFVQVYPNHTYTADAQAMLNFITQGMNSLEEFANKRAKIIQDSLARVKKNAPAS